MIILREEGKHHSHGFDIMFTVASAVLLIDQGKASLSLKSEPLDISLDALQVSKLPGLPLTELSIGLKEEEELTGGSHKPCFDIPERLCCYHHCPKGSSLSVDIQIKYCFAIPEEN